MTGHDKYAKAIDNTKNLVSMANTLWDQVTGASARSGDVARLDSAAKTIKSQMTRVLLQVRVLETELENC